MNLLGKLLGEKPMQATGVLTMNKGKTTQEIIDEIHDTFDTEVDRILKDASVLRSEESPRQRQIDKAERLLKHGFGASDDVVKSQAEVERLKDVKRLNQSNKVLCEAVNYFSKKYPLYKFITDDSVKKICEKYGLVYGEVSKYKGFVPEKNLKHIENFKIDKEDACYSLTVTTIFSISLGITSRTIDIGYDRFCKGETIGDEHHFESFSECPLEIAAPVKDFNFNKSELKDFKITSKIEIPDPVVLQPVFYKGTKHYLIVTAWGDEASDPLVVNEKMN